MRLLIRLGVLGSGIAVALVCGIVIYTARVGHLPAVGGSEFSDDFEAPEIDGKRWVLDADEGCDFSVMPNPAGDGTALRIAAPEGARCELLPMLRKNFLGEPGHDPRGALLRYSFKTFVGEDQVLTDRNEILAQWHGHPDKVLGDASSRGPALALRMAAGSEFLTATSDSQFISAPGRRDRPVWRGPLELGSWVRWDFEVIWRYQQDGVLRVWRQGEQILDQTGPNTFNDLRNVYLKVGVYHPGGDREVYFDDFRFQLQER